MKISNEEKTNNYKTADRGILKNLKSTYKYAKKGRKYLWLFLIINILMTVISVVAPVLGAQRLLALTNNNYQKLLVIIFGIFTLEILRNFSRLAYNYFYNKFYYDVRRNLQIELVRETLKITQQDLNTNSSGVFIERINGDTDNLTDIFTSLIDYISSIIGNLGVLIVVFFINWILGLIYVGLMIVIILYNKFASGINYKNRKEWKKSRERTGGFISEIVRGSKDVKILDAEESFLAKANEFMSETNEVSYKYQRERAILRLFGGSIRDIGDLLVGVFIFIFLKSGSVNVAIAIIIYNYNDRILWTADWIEQIFEIIKQFNLAANRIFGILEENEFTKEQFGTKKLKKFEGNIEFKDVCFAYEKDMPVLKNMNFKIKANETIGFVGPSGSGKTTIFNLISALERVNQGTITFDGLDINALDKSSIRGNLSVISQNAYIFNMSILDNLKVIKQNATEKEIKEACHLACLDDFIETLPNKYDTIVGEGGVTLSGGQKQRLAIARALLLKTEILLFDEATSALDNETQTKIQEAISNLKGEYTILIIAHRLSTVINADKIFVINDGMVEATGSHKTLLKTSLTYQKLYEKEAKETQKSPSLIS